MTFNWHDVPELRPFDAWSPSDRLAPARTALVVVDLQYGSGSRHHGIGRRMQEEGREHEGVERFDRIEAQVVPNTVRLLDTFRHHGGFVVYLTVNPLLSDFRDIPRNRRGLAAWKSARPAPIDPANPPREHQVLDEVRPAADELVLNKATIGGFNSSSLHNVLRSAGIDTIVACGVSTNSCIESTVRSAADRSFKVILAEDACGAALDQFHEQAVATLQGQFCVVASTDDVCRAMEGATDSVAPSTVESQS